MERKPINLAEKFSRFSDHWSPKIIAQMNDYHFKLVKFEGEFVWHNHAESGLGLVDRYRTGEQGRFFECSCTT